jgi:hypothetical protein
MATMSSDIATLTLTKVATQHKQLPRPFKQSLKVLQLNGLEVEISFLHGNAGGGASVQSLQPECVRIGTIPEHSDYINCVLHAIHLAYKKALVNSLGDQGMGKNTPFQFCYLALLMFNVIKQQGGLELL